MEYRIYLFNTKNVSKTCVQQQGARISMERAKGRKTPFCFPLDVCVTYNDPADGSARKTKRIKGGEEEEKNKQRILDFNDRMIDTFKRK